MAKPYILCVDDERIVLEALLNQLRSHLGPDYMFERAENGAEALQLVDEIQALHRDLAVCVSDQMMPGIRGHELLINLHQRSPLTVNILLTGVTTTEELGLAINRANLYRFLNKPWEPLDLQLTVEEAARSWQKSRKIAEYTQSLETLVQASHALADELTIGNLVHRVLNHLIEGTGVDRGGILVFDKGAVIAEEYFDRNYKGFNFHQDGSRFPQTVIRAASLGDEYLHMHSPGNNTLLLDSYRREFQPRGIYCRPLHYSDQLVAVLYLESSFRKNHFTSDRLKFIELLGNAAVLSIVKLKLINNLESMVEERTREVLQQKRVIETKSQDILDSMQYASRLQTTFMQPLDVVEKTLPESFIIYQPKSLISGDFYWAHDSESFIHMAVVDCTGHGVPGAMLSIMGINLLDQLIMEDGIVRPDEVLNRMNKFIHTRLGNNYGTSKNLDSMDIALVAFNKHTRQLDFSGARRPLYLLRKGKIHEFKGNPYSLGGSPLFADPQYRYELAELNLQPEDRVLLFTDGITDQFGGPNDRKFTANRLRQIIETHSHSPLSSIQNAIEMNLMKWRGGNEQTDDILMLGLSFDQAALPGEGNSYFARNTLNPIEIASLQHLERLLDIAGPA